MKQSMKSKRHSAGLRAKNPKRKKAIERDSWSAKPWRDTHMPTAGAELYVVAQLLFRDIDAFKCERGRAGIDVVAADTRHRSSVGIQVKSRYATASDGFPIVKPRADFVVFVRLNLDTKKRQPDCYIFPASVVKRAIAVGPSGKWHKCHLRRIRNVEQYREAWGLIAKALKKRIT